MFDISSSLIMAKRGEFFVMSNCNNYLFCHEKFLHCTYFIYLSVSTLGIADYILQQFITEIALTNSEKLSSVSSDGRHSGVDRRGLWFRSTLLLSLILVRTINKFYSLRPWEQFYCKQSNRCHQIYVKNTSAVKAKQKQNRLQ